MIGEESSNMVASPRTLRLLLIDDDKDDRALFAAALEETRLKVDLFVATDGYTGLSYLYGSGQYADRSKFPFPDVVFVDVKMPGLNGFGVLRQIRSNLKSKTVPVIMLSNSGLQMDVQEAYASGANAFQRKPATFNTLVNLLRAELHPWHTVLSQIASSMPHN
jgi:two-component system response regulator